MHSIRTLIVAHALALGSSVLSAQQPIGVAEAPPGANWIADRKSKQYYPVSCSAATTVPRPDRLYYSAESAVRQDGYVPSPECGAGDYPRLEDAPPRHQDAPVGNAARSVSADSNLPHNPRRGFWFSGGFGYGSLGCEDCSGREGGLSGGLQLGGSVSQKVLLGGGTTGWTKSEGGVTLTVGTAVALIRFYPSSSGGFFLLGGLGLGTIYAQIDGFGSDTEAGGAALVGLGYDIRVGPSVSLTPFWNGFAVRTSNADANVGQLGLSVTLH